MPRLNKIAVTPTNEWPEEKPPTMRKERWVLVKRAVGSPKDFIDAYLRFTPKEVRELFGISASDYANLRKVLVHPVPVPVEGEVVPRPGIDTTHERPEDLADQVVSIAIERLQDRIQRELDTRVKVALAKALMAAADSIRQD